MGTVLIAEDDSDVRETLKGIVSTQGHSIMEAEDGEKALEILSRDLVDVLILDLHMPRKDGLSVLREIDVPPPMVIIYSAFEYYSIEEIKDQVGSKVFRALRKPVPPLELIAAVSEGVAAAEDFGR
jgi:CheY-like chemotaxis protein